METGRLFFTDIVSDVFTGQYCVMCAIPVYDGNGKLVAVAGADLFLDNMETYVNASDQSDGFVCIVNERGHVVFSPRAEGIFQVKGNGEAVDLRSLGNEALAVSKRIVKPLETMTKQVVSLGGENLQFMMEDTYRTGDEIEALAESFATLSARTLEYVSQVRKVTAEKERMIAGLNEDTAAAPEQLLKNVRKAVDGFVKEAERFDDLTMLCLVYSRAKPSCQIPPAILRASKDDSCESNT